MPAARPPPACRLSGKGVRALAAVALATASGCAGQPGSGSARVTPASTSRPVIARLPAAPHWLYTVVNVVCTIGIDGRAAGCSVPDRDADPAFARSAVEYMQALRFKPPIRDGAATAEVEATPIGFLQPGVMATASPPQIAVLPHVAYPAGIGPEVGRVVVYLGCAIEITGDTSHCMVTSADGPPAFASAALDAASKALYSPAWRAGHPERTADYPITVVFKPPLAPFARGPALPAGVVVRNVSPGPLLGYPAAMLEREREGEVLIACDLGTDGVNRNCAIAEIHGDAAFGQPALAYIAALHQFATRDGVPVAVPGMLHAIRFTRNEDRW